MYGCSSCDTSDVAGTAACCLVQLGVSWSTQSADADAGPSRGQEPDGLQQSPPIPIVCWPHSQRDLVSRTSRIQYKTSPCPLTPRARTQPHQPSKRPSSSISQPQHTQHTRASKVQHRACAEVIKPPDSSVGMCRAGLNDRPPPRCRPRGPEDGRTGGDGARPIADATSSRPARFEKDARGVLVVDWPMMESVPQDATGWNGRPGAVLKERESFTAEGSRFTTGTCRGAWPSRRLQSLHGFVRVRSVLQQATGGARGGSQNIQRAGGSVCDSTGSGCISAAGAALVATSTCCEWAVAQPWSSILELTAHQTHKQPMPDMSSHVPRQDEPQISYLATTVNFEACQTRTITSKEAMEQVRLK